MKVAVASDHRGYTTKKFVIDYLKNQNYTVKDYGTTSEELTDYPIYAKKLCENIGKEVERGILICGTGIGMSIVANKIKGIRCARVINKEEASIARKHNNANILAFGENIEKEEIKEMLDNFLKENFNKEERYQRREKQITELENEY